MEDVFHSGSLACALLVALLLAACTSAPPPQPDLLARCTQRYALWWRYLHGTASNHNGQRAIAELALHRCQTGQYHPAIEDLEDMLRRSRVPLPDAP